MLARHTAATALVRQLSTAPTAAAPGEKVSVVGGGVFGVSSAYFLSKMGYDVNEPLPA